MKTLTRILTLSLALILLFSFAACNTPDPDAPTVRVYTLNGTTGFGMAKMMNDHMGKTDYQFIVQTDASVITAALLSGDVDIAALPTNAAANLYNKSQGQIQILAINTLGCLYLLDGSGNPVTDFSQLAGKTVYTPAQNPSFILKYLKDAKGVDFTIDSATYTQPEALKNAVVAGQVDLFVLPEPMVTVVKNATKGQGKTFSTIDLTEVWNTVSDQALVQGCIVARKEFIDANPALITSFLTEYKASIEFMQTNTAEAAQMVADQGIFANANVAKLAIPNCNVTYMDGVDMKNAMKSYINALYTVAPASVGNAIPDDGFYYNAN